MDEEGDGRMFFEEFTPNIKILSVMKLSWDESNGYAKPRKFHAISFRVKGNANYALEGQNLSVTNGDFLYIPQNVGYHIEAKEEELYVIHFKSRDIKQNFLEVCQMYNFSKVKSLFANCYEAWTKKEPGYYYKVLALFYLILEQVSISTASEFIDESYLKIKPAVDYIHMHFHKPNLSVNMLCELVNMSDTYFRKLFYQHLKTTPIKYINKLRISYAKDLINSDYYKIIQIAKASGFEDEKYFSRTFKEQTGYTPTEYKDL